ncbi:hypothetical protein QEG73_21935 [Chitinophagaceae bacterium 26-R-25]|nr:hypothetical protein [Chitinophagaceae bacterium 26-R-25]
MSIVVSDIITQYGSYYIDGGQSTQDLYKKLYQPSVTASFFQARPTKNTQYRVGSGDLDRVLQPFQKQFTPIGTFTAKANPIDLFNLKIDKQEYPDEIVDSWLGFLEGDGIDRSQWPFVRWLLEEHVIPKAQEDYELNEAYAGVFAAPTAGTAGAAGTAMNGIKKQIANYVTGGLITPITMGAIPATDEDFCTYVETFVASIPDLYRAKIDYIFMSPALELKYRKGKRAKYNANWGQDTDLWRLADFPNIKVQALPSMSGSNKLWATFASNRIRPLRKAQNMNNSLIVNHSPRLVDIYTDWWEVLGFLYPPAVFVSDQA